MEKQNNLLYNLPDDVLHIIFEYDNRYKGYKKKVIYELRGYRWWFHVTKFWFPNRDPSFNKWMLGIRRKRLLKIKQSK